ncbi:MAG: hypothetical protein H6855_04335 [Rhodospirillales bacterium]|nr:hypothetical protein [Rhodospirillales bacterium]MCB9965292.1 hypothetical protein [Rhodospirillales bacterium]MCB9972939.1 hypothetical protein [Rhodospirillales bacterium]MCB9980123.1 hypothetical protein [Rhodospirillales bacterium]
MIERYNPGSRYRQRTRNRFFAFVFIVVTLCFAAVVGFWFGGQTYQARITAQDAQITVLTEETETLRNELTSALTKVQETDMRYTALQSETEALLPSDSPLRDLLSLLRKRLEEGVTQDRLVNLLETTRPPRNCTDPESKRFVVVTPGYKGPDSSVMVDGSTLEVSATGVSARNKNGQDEAWYDEGQPVEITFKKAGGEVETKSGTLPMMTTLIVKNREYRLNLSAGAKSFLKVVYDSCDYP